METQVSIDKFVVDYKNVPHSAFLRLYMITAMKYKVKMTVSDLKKADLIIKMDGKPVIIPLPKEYWK